MSDDRKSPLPEQLPEDAKGYTKQLVMHLNFGKNGGSATYSIKDEKGELMPFNYAYRSGSKKKAENYSGFIIEGHQDKALTWKELCAVWPEFLARTQATSPVALVRVMEGKP